MKAERERSRSEMKDLQQQLSEMHDELDRAEKSEAVNAQTELLLKVKRKPRESTRHKSKFMKN